MHRLVITSASGVADNIVSGVASGLGLRVANRLDDRAVEFTLDPEQHKPDKVAEGARRALAAHSVDANVTPVAGREKRILICDMDSTIIGCECIDELADFAGVKPEVSGITERAMRGEIDFESALRERVKLLAGLPTSALEAVLQERVRLNPGADTLVRTMAAKGAATALVSGGFTYFAERVGAFAGFARTQANRLIERDGRLTGEVADPILGKDAKLTALMAMAQEIGATPTAAAAVGDGANDLAMIEAAGLGVAYRAKPAVAARAAARLEHSDLTAVLSLQGIGADRFVV